jgi:hypothetical protein
LGESKDLSNKTNGKEHLFGTRGRIPTVKYKFPPISSARVLVDPPKRPENKHNQAKVEEMHSP